jgi:GH35 family endo-1,4-beta-xylanase
MMGTLSRQATSSSTWIAPLHPEQTSKKQSLTTEWSWLAPLYLSNSKSPGFCLINPGCSKVTHHQDPELAQLADRTSPVSTLLQTTAISKNPWDVQYIYFIQPQDEINFSINDTYVVEVWLKSASNSTQIGKTEIILELRGEPHTKLFQKHVGDIPCQWKKYCFQFQPNISLEGCKTQLCLRMGYGIQGFFISYLTIGKVVCSIASSSSSSSPSSSSVGHGLFFLTNPSGSHVTFAKQVDPHLFQAGIQPSFSTLVQTTSKNSKAPWDTQYIYPFLNNDNISFNKDDIMLIELWLRSDASASSSFGGNAAAAQTDIVLELNREPYTKLCSQHFPHISFEWTKYNIPFVCPYSFADISQVQLCLRMGYGVQGFHIADLRVTNYKQTRKMESLVSSFRAGDYEGCEEGAEWRQHAFERIKEHRMGLLEVVVKDSEGRAIKNANVAIRMKKHTFGFGTAVTGRLLAQSKANGIVGGGYGGEDDGSYRMNVKGLFNRVVFENDMKWKQWITAHCADGSCDYKRSYIDASIDWLQKNGIEIRGHTLLWGSWKYVPNEVAILQKDPIRLSQKVLDHVETITRTLGPFIAEWDVINEPTTSCEILELLGPSLCAQVLHTTQQISPHAKLYINDFPNPSMPNLLPSAIKLIHQLTKDYNAPLHGYGIQAHIGTTPWSICWLLNSLQQLETTFPHLDIQITEYDTSITDEELDANYLRDFMVAVFSVKNVKGFMTWGFWDGAHWNNKAPFFRKDWSEKAALRIFKDLVFNQWWTNEEGRTDGEGRFGVRGYCGEYDVCVTVGGKEVRRALVLEKGGVKVEIVV